MKIAISQPRYLPAINYIQRVLLADIFVLLDCVQHQPRAFEHRNKIKTPSGPIWLSIPLRRDHSRMVIKDLKVENTQWKEKHLETIGFFYKRAKFFDEALLADLYAFRYEYLVDINEYMLRRVLSLLGVDRVIIRSSSLNLKQEHDKKLAEIVKILDGDVYLSGPNGRHYINKDNFPGLTVLYHDFYYPWYSQLWGEFVPWLAFPDVLFNVGIEQFSAMLRCNYELRPE